MWAHYIHCRISLYIEQIEKNGDNQIGRKILEHYKIINEGNSL